MAKSQDARLNVDVLGARAVAQIVDGIIQMILMVALLVGIGGVAGVASSTSESLATGFGIVALLVAFAALFFYNAGLEYYWDGQTVGKRLMGIQVLDESGNPASFGQAIVRNIPAIFNLGIFSLIAALISMETSDKKQRIFDAFANTIVVEKHANTSADSTATQSGQSTQF